jgi:MFS family permease
MREVSNHSEYMARALGGVLIGILVVSIASLFGMVPFARAVWLSFGAIAGWLFGPVLASKFRRFQFSLRTMFVLVTVACIVLAWVGHSMIWIRERRAMFENGRVERVRVGISIRQGGPYGLWLFGEYAEPYLACREEDVETAHRLFPETKGRFWLNVDP